MKKITAAVLVFSIVALLGVSLIAAFPLGFGKGMNSTLTEEEQIEAQAFHNALQQTIEDEDFDSWKSLMESQLTEENFNSLVERHQQMEQERETRQAYCEENGCPNFEEHSGQGQGMKKGSGQRGMSGECPFAKSGTKSE